MRPLQAGFLFIYAVGSDVVLLALCQAYVLQASLLARPIGAHAKYCKFKRSYAFIQTDTKSTIAKGLPKNP